MVTQEVKDVTKSQPAKDGPSIQPKTAGSTGGTSSGANPHVPTEAEIEMKLKLLDEQNDIVYGEVISYLDWDLTHQDPEPDFKAFYIFASDALQKQKPELQSFVSKLPKHAASRRVGNSGKETGNAWEITDKAMAQDLEAGVKVQQPRLFLGYDVVTIDGKQMPCRVASTA